MKSLSASFSHLIKVIVCSLIFLTMSCQKDEFDNVKNSIANQSDDPTLQWLLKMGFSRDKIKDLGEFYVVEGDMRFKKSKLRR